MEPIVTVIVPSHDRHLRYLPNALASIEGQTVAGLTETIVINDGTPGILNNTGLNVIDTGGAMGASYARNLGIEAAKTPWLLFLDSDDYLTPWGVEGLLRGAASRDTAYVYGDHWVLRDNQFQLHQNRSYEQLAFIERNLHPVTILLSTRVAQASQGFDPEIKRWEDWDFFLKLAIMGFCGSRVPVPIFVYRLDTGYNRNDATRQGLALMEHIRDRYKDNGGRITMAGCCGNDSRARQAAKQAVDTMGENNLMATSFPDGTVRMEYIGTKQGSTNFRGKVTGTRYRGGLAFDRYANVQRDDVAGLLESGKWRVTERYTGDTNAPKPPINVPAPVNFHDDNDGTIFVDDEPTKLPPITGKPEKAPAKSGAEKKAENQTNVS